MNRSVNYVLVVAILIGAYIGSYYVLPRRLGGGFPPPPKTTFGNAAYNFVFYPMRWTNGRLTVSYPVTVQRIDFERREIFVMANERVGYFVPFRNRDEPSLRALHPGDRIRFTVENLPHVFYDTSYSEFRSYRRLE